MQEHHVGVFGAYGHTGRFVAAELKRRGLNKLVQMVKDTPEIVEAFHITGKECLQAKIVVCDLQTLEIVVDRFGSCASTETSVIQSVTVAQRLPKL
jgi:putative NADH-flavin reductase